MIPIHFHIAYFVVGKINKIRRGIIPFLFHLL
nr:MAG TPA: hypothetical protein [Caudoviricetes sp.]